MSPTKATKKSTRKSTATSKSSKGFTADERAAMKEHARELKAERAGADGEKDVLAAIAKMPALDRAMAKRFHTIMKDNAPGLAPKTWYGMPAYAKDGKVVCFFRSADKFKERYAMVGFQDTANLDKGDMWPVAFALQKLTATEEAKIAALVKKAAS